jgi:adenosyl cobinamide kinase/adenosyl cobinamide phosphate guanylyltransferase
MPPSELDKMQAAAKQAKELVFVAQDAAGRIVDGSVYADNFRELLARIRSLLEQLDNEVTAARNGWPTKRVRPLRARSRRRD